MKPSLLAGRRHLRLQMPVVRAARRIISVLDMAYTDSPKLKTEVLPTDYTYYHIRIVIPTVYRNTDGIYTVPVPSLSLSSSFTVRDTGLSKVCGTNYGGKKYGRTCKRLRLEALLWDIKIDFKEGCLSSSFQSFTPLSHFLKQLKRIKGAFVKFLRKTGRHSEVEAEARAVRSPMMNSQCAESGLFSRDLQANDQSLRVHGDVHWESNEPLRTCRRACLSNIVQMVVRNK